VAHDLLENAPSGTFLIRPSSHRGMYALSWRKGAQVRDNIIYCCWPGYALRKTPPDSERFASLTSLVSHCPFLRAPCTRQLDESSVMNLLQEQLELFFAQLATRVVVDAVSGEKQIALEWELCLLEALDTYMVTDLCERRTSIRCGNQECVFPTLFHMSMTHASALASALAPPSTARCAIHRLTLNGFEGMGRQNFSPVLGDETFSALCVALQGNTTVADFDVAVNRIGDAGAQGLAELLASTTTLKRVSVSHNQITSAGLVLLAKGLRLNKSLDELVLVPQMVPGTSPRTVSQDSRSDRVAGALSNSLKRKQELVLASGTKSARVHGLMSDADAQALLLAVRPAVPHLYILYLSAQRPDTVQLAYTALVAGGTMLVVHHRTIYRHNRGYSCRPIVASLTRHAAWRAWATGLAGTRNVCEAIEHQFESASYLFHLWRCEQIDEDDGDTPLVPADPWLGEYPTLVFLTSALRAHLKIGLNKKERRAM
jgi:hypothetical protein